MPCSTGHVCTQLLLHAPSIGLPAFVTISYLCGVHAPFALPDAYVPSLVTAQAIYGVALHGAIIHDSVFSRRAVFAVAPVSPVVAVHCAVNHCANPCIRRSNG
eukprot:366093-Chlamydomonas_euryale.AAC.4